MDFLKEIVANINTFLWTYVLIASLIGLGLYFSFRTKFVQVRMIKEMFRLLVKGGRAKDGGVSSFQAFLLSAASKVGAGNIAGVATAIALGGPGAVFWMWLIAIIGSASSFIESTLAQIYKVREGDGFRGGPGYYIKKALKQRWLGITFSVLITVCYGFIFNSVQANTIAASFEAAFSINTSVMAVVLAVLTVFSIFGGFKRLMKIVEIVIPFMAIAYMGVALVVVIMNIQSMPYAFMMIFQNAFGFNEMAGGTMGAAMMYGIRRGLFSNEAGMGSTPNAAATASVSHPVKQGLVQSFSVFVDTLIICSATVFIILLSDVNYAGGAQGVALVQSALATHVGNWAYAFIALCILLFSFTSIIGNYFYGETNIEFLTGGNKRILFAFRLAVVGMVTFGAMARVEFVWSLADLFVALMAITNLYAIVRLSPTVFAALKDYTKQKKAGKDPVFYSSSLSNPDGMECWPTTEEDAERELTA